MNPCALFIQRPVMTTLLMFALLLFGAFGYFKLPISALPDVDFPTITINASLPGANAQTMAATVATPLEKQFATIAGITQMTSSSSTGSTQIVLQFDLDRNIDAAAGDVQSAISVASRSLPTTMPSQPSYKKVNPSDAPILYIVLSSKILPLSEVDKYAESILAQQISMSPGVAQVNVYGSQKYAVRAELNPNLLATKQLSLIDIANAIGNSNVTLPTGSLNGSRQALTINNNNGQLNDAKAFQSLIVAYKNGAPVRLNQIGNVIDSVQNNQVASWLNDERGIVLGVQRQPGTNTIEVINNIKKLLPRFNAQLPAAVKLNIVYDRSESIRASVRDVEITLLVAAFLVVLVIFAFLRNLSATIIPSIALPLSLIGTFAVMSYFHFTLDNISLLALTLVVGYVIDDAIVMLENITRHMERGESPYQAALKGSKEIGFTIVSMTLSLFAVFIPVLFMGGLIGRLFHEFAVTTVTAILLSGIISLTLTPMLCSRFLRHENHKTNRLAHLNEAIFNAALNLYNKTLTHALNNRKKVLFIFLLTIVFSALLSLWVPKGFVPNEDVGQLTAFTEADPDVSFSEMVKRQQEAVEIVLKNPSIIDVISSVGAGGTSGTVNMGRIFIHLKPLNQRKYSADQIIQQLRPVLSHIPGLSVYIQGYTSIPTGAKQSKSTYQFSLQDSDYNELQTWTQKFTDAISKLPQLEDVTNDIQNSAPQINLTLDRDKASALGISPNAFQQTLGYAYGSQQVSTIYTPIDDYEVIMELAPQYQKNASVLNQLYIPTTSGEQVPIQEISKFDYANQPLTVNHLMQFPSATISFNLKPGVALSKAVTEIQNIQKELHPPITLSTSFQGTAQSFQESQAGMGLLLILAVIVIYIILGILYESFIHPLTILSGLPAAAVGALITLILFNSELDLYSFIGIIMLIGIVKKNAIMMIDFALDAQRKENKSALEAIHQACLIRFRPIMMTTMAAILGALPIAMATGQGAETRRPLGLAVVGGLLLSQLLTLYITPVIYLYFEKLRNRRNQ